MRYGATFNKMLNVRRATPAVTMRLHVFDGTYAIYGKEKGKRKKEKLRPRAADRGKGRRTY
jgi:hypothetical protein